MIPSAEEFLRLRQSREESEYTRAGAEEAPFEVWLAVIEKYPGMRRWVPINKTVPLEILAMLARDGDPSVRAAVADRRRLNAELFDALSLDEDEFVRSRVAANKKAPFEIVLRLAEDPAAHVRSIAQRRLTQMHPPRKPCQT
ncbi:hypothetical protein [Inhella sp.]|uniref:hypothetical protein n=1 Tax=Inhella sp. TaxID=1921806 RepID=UPI0035B1B05E